MPFLAPDVHDERDGLAVFARHAGHADLIREALDGCGAYERTARLEEVEGR